jgi:Acyl-[acyl carrier protein]--UDP-N-acetylglucosamine O-acyltransferase
VIGPNAVIGPRVRIGANCRIGASAIIDGSTELGDGCEVYPFASVGQVPQDLKFKGEDTRLTIGRRNIFREFVTIPPRHAGGGGVTTIGDRNLCSWRTCTWRTTATSATNDLRQHGDARRPRHRRRLRRTSAPDRRASVLPRRPPRVHRRLLGRDEGRAAVRADRRQPSRPHLRREFDRSDAARGSRRTSSRS